MRWYLWASVCLLIAVQASVIHQSSSTKIDNGSQMDGVKGRSPAHHREKRDTFASFVSAVLRTLVCAIFCQSYTGSPGSVIPPPTISCPPDVDIVLQEGSTSTDIVLGQVTAIQSGSDFTSGIILEDTNIPYLYVESQTWKAKDVAQGTYHINFGVQGSNDIARCQNTVTVQLVTCPMPPGIPHGYPEFIVSPVLGTSLPYTCNIGYYISAGSATLICGSGGVWSGTPPTCQVVTCPELTAPAHGRVVCQRPLHYGAVCTYECEAGFSPGVRSDLQAMCHEDASWGGSFSECVDTEPPTLTLCPDGYVVTADKGMDDAVVTFQEPVYQDTSGTVTLRQDSGQASGTRFKAGTHLMVFTGVDSNGNHGQACSFTIDVLSIRCSRIPFLSMDISLNPPVCSLENLYGSTCTFSCQHGLTLEGATTTTCEADGKPPKGFWTHISDPPSCKRIDCPDLLTSEWTTISCGRVLTGEVCAPECEPDFEFEQPESGKPEPPEVYSCPDSTGDWLPSQQVPECIVSTGGDPWTDLEMGISGTNKPPDIRGPVSIFAENEGYTGLTILMSTSARRKRSTNPDHVIAQFSLSLPIVETIDYSSNAAIALDVLDNVAQSLNVAVLTGQFKLGVIAGQTLTAESVHQITSAAIKCEPGYVPSEASLRCVRCSRGSFFTEVTSSCVSCPRGSYQNMTGQIFCTQCPVGQSTEGTGVRTMDMCKDVCPAGSYSLTGLADCELCGVGEYQELTGQTECKQCPDGTTTIVPGGVTCVGIDIAFNGSHALASNLFVSGMYPALSLVFSFASTGVNTGCSLFTIASFGFERLKLVLSRQTLILTTTSPQDSVDFSTPLQQDSWYLVTMIIDKLAGRLIVQLENGESKTVSLTTAYLFGIYQKHQLGLNCKVRLSNINVWRQHMTAAGVTNPSKCTPIELGDLSSWPNFLHKVQREANTFVRTSQCKETAACSSMPCQNGGVCTEIKDTHGYLCRCQQGYTGATCETNIKDCQANSCKNGGTCVDGLASYTCECMPGYLGENCNIIIVDGGWGAWTEWGLCSKTCDSGQTRRDRVCNNPAPQNGGANCTGYAIGLQSCNTQSCPECSAIAAPTFGSIDCQAGTDSGVKTCTISCDDGYGSSRFKHDSYECGPITAYLWTDQKPGDSSTYSPVICSVIDVPQSLSILTLLVYSDISCTVNRPNLLEHALVVVYSLPCGQTCQTKAEKHGCKGKSTTIEVTTTVTMARTSGQELNNATLMSFVDGFNRLEAFSEKLQNSIAKGDFNAGYKGVTYVPSSSIVGYFTCPTGKVRAENACVSCQVGTYYKDSNCFPCPVGMYQREEGEMQCDVCPEGWTTEDYRSDDIADCSVKEVFR